jgi:hypothetical protein
MGHDYIIVVWVIDVMRYHGKYAEYMHAASCTYKPICTLMCIGNIAVFMMISTDKIRTEDNSTPKIRNHNANRIKVRENHSN